MKRLAKDLKAWTELMIRHDKALLSLSWTVLALNLALRGRPLPKVPKTPQGAGLVES
jgi:hypothetical protein